MKNAVHISILILLPWIACFSPLSVAATPDCAGVFFSPDDFNHEHPMQKPHPDFLKSYKLALAGNVIEQRNVAVSYDAGYLVSACPVKAHFWYQKAADNQDQIAQNWIAHYNQFKAILDGPEFAVVNHVDPPQTLASIPASAKKTIAGNGQQSTPTSAEGMLAQLSPPSNTAVDLGKMAEIGRLVIDLIKEPAAPAKSSQNH
jgi:hypothetical protein